MTETVTLHLPLIFPDGQGLWSAEGPSPPRLDGYPVQLQKHKFQHFTLYALSVSGVPVEAKDEVRAKLDALAPWLSMKARISFKVHKGPMIKSDGYHHFAHPAWYPTDMDVNPQLGMGWGLNERGIILSAALQEAQTATLLVPDIANHRLAAAFELYTGVDFETSPSARFILLTTILEVLKQQRPRISSHQTIIARWAEEVHEMRRRLASNSDESNALHSLMSVLGHARNETIGQAIRRLVETSASRMGKGDPRGLAKTAVALYGERSSFVHDGRPIPEEDVHKLRDIVEMVLEAAARVGNVESAPKSSAGSRWRKLMPLLGHRLSAMAELLGFKMKDGVSPPPHCLSKAR